MLTPSAACSSNAVVVAAVTTTLAFLLLYRQEATSQMQCRCENEGKFIVGSSGNLQEVYLPNNDEGSGKGLLQATYVVCISMLLAAA